MKTQYSVARFVRQKIQEIGKSEQEIAKESGGEQLNAVEKIAQGAVELPLSKVGTLAKALKANPVQLMTLWMREYHPETWGLVEPFFESTLTSDEVKMVRAWRSYVGCPYVAALSDESQNLLTRFLSSLKTPASMH